MGWSVGCVIGVCSRDPQVDFGGWVGLLASHTVLWLVTAPGWPPWADFGGRSHCSWKMTLNVISGQFSKFESKCCARTSCLSPVSRRLGGDLWLRPHRTPPFLPSDCRAEPRGPLCPVLPLLCLPSDHSQPPHSGSGTFGFSPPFPLYSYFMRFSGVFTTGLAISLTSE